MAREAELTLDSVLQKISAKELIGAELQDSQLIYSVVGFLPASDFADNALLISNISYILSQKGLNTCVIDLKVFYPNLYQFLDTKPNKRGNGLLKLLKSDKIDYREEILQTKYERLFLLSPSPHDLIEEYLDFEFEHLERVITSVKNMFDIILIDIPNIPPLEFCLGAMKYCHIGFLTASERIEASINMTKLLDFAASIGISTSKFKSVIMMNLQNIDYDYESLKDLGFQIVAALPLVKAANASPMEGSLYIKDTSLINKQFRKEIRRLADLLANQ
jgi:cellulose biosynthesis protein BcsQ